MYLTLCLFLSMLLLPAPQKELNILSGLHFTPTETWCLLGKFGLQFYHPQLARAIANDYRNGRPGA